MANAAELLDTLSLVDCAAAIAAGDVSAEAITGAVLDRIDRFDGQFGALLHVDREGALATAASTDQARKAGAALGPLAGVPVTVKDLISVPGMPLTAASKILRGYEPPFTATVARRLRDAGAVIIGKNNLDEFAMGSSNENSAFGNVANPWAPDRVPGGSSGGSAAAVAAGYGFGSLGTDTGGSIRLPASLCGVVGIKPTYGRVSRYGVVAFASSLDQVGPLALTVDDAALLLSVIGGHDALDSTSATEPLGDLRSGPGSLEGRRIGVPREFLDDAEGLDPGVASCIRGSIDALKSAGATIVDVSLPHTPLAIATYYLVATAEASSNLSRYDGVRFGHRATLAQGEGITDLYERSRGEGFGPEVKRRIMLGTFALSSGYYDAYYERACRVRRLIHDDYVSALKSCDVLVGPTSPVPAWRLGECTDDPLAMYLMDIFTTGASLAGVPAMSVPVGTTQNLPVGLQLIGRHFDEETMIDVARGLEKALNLGVQRPNLDALADESKP